MSKILLCQHFEEHLGSYEHSMAVGMLGRGLVPAQPENGEVGVETEQPSAQSARVTPQHDAHDESPLFEFDRKIAAIGGW